MASDNLVYRVSPPRRAVLWCVLGFFLLAGLALVVGGDAPSRAAGATLAALMAACLAAWEWLLARTCVALTTSGVELHQLGIHMRAAWADVEALCLQRGREGFILNAPMANSGADRLAAFRRIGAPGLAYYDEERQALLRDRRFIPIEAFAWHARRGNLTAQVARLAPHVRVIG